MKFSRNILFGVFIILVWEFCSAKLDKEFELFKMKFSRKYQNSTEERNRKLQFEKTDRKIVKHNQEYNKGKQLYKMSHNRFSDRFTEEKNKILMKVNYKNHTSNKRNKRQLPTPSTVPDSFSWLERRWITPVLDQGDCASCYAFAAAGTIEAAYFIRNRVHIKLSEQEVLDCSVDFQNKGCIGGYLATTFDYVKIYGLSLNAVYPYRAERGVTCLKSIPPTYITDYYSVPYQNEEALKHYVANYGPVAVTITANYNLLQHSEGIYYDRNCNPYEQNHNLIVVGYGTERGIDYWLVKNSWGNRWADQGYAKIIRNRNQCGIANNAFVPIL